MAVHGNRSERQPILRVYLSRSGDHRTRTAAAIAFALLFRAVAVAVALAPPASIVNQLGSLQLVSRFAALPAPIRAGDFRVDGVSAKGWQMAEPGEPFNATDTPIGNAPGRRFIFAGCDASLCLLHYERGGAAHMYFILALQPSHNGWKVVWNAIGPKRLADLSAMRALLRAQVPSNGWAQQWVKGDF